MRNFLILLITCYTFILSSCANKKCEDNKAVNFEREGECLYCTSSVTTETVTIKVTDVFTNSPLYGQEVAEVTLDRKFSAFVGNGCGLDYDWRQTPSCEINMKLKNISNKTFSSYNFTVEYTLNDMHESKSIYTSNDLKLLPNQETTLQNFSNSICGNLKDATITVTTKYLYY
ncbi:MAG: hypothetical protein V4667_03665 [Bacteroidota bacterium]